MIEARREFARLKMGAKMGAKVGSYLRVLTASNVRGMLRRKARLAAEAERAAGASLSAHAAGTRDSKVDPRT